MYIYNHLKCLHFNCPFEQMKFFICWLQEYFTCCLHPEQAHFHLLPNITFPVTSTKKFLSCSPLLLLVLFVSKLKFFNCFPEFSSHNSFLSFKCLLTRAVQVFSIEWKSTLPGDVKVYQSA